MELILQHAEFLKGNLSKQAATAVINVKSEHATLPSKCKEEGCVKLASMAMSLEQQQKTSAAELERVKAESAQLKSNFDKLSNKHQELMSKEITVRRIAKKYKSQVDELLAERRTVVADRDHSRTELILRHNKQVEALHQKITSLTSQVCTLFKFIPL